MPKKRGYHHGNLRQALVEAALGLIEEKGPTGFTLSLAAKEAGVTPAAVQNVVANAIKQNPSIASVGDIADVPRYDAVASLF